MRNFGTNMLTLRSVFGGRRYLLYVFIDFVQGSIATNKYDDLRDSYLFYISKILQDLIE